MKEISKETCHFRTLATLKGEKTFAFCLLFVSIFDELLFTSISDKLLFASVSDKLLFESILDKWDATQNIALKNKEILGKRIFTLAKVFTVLAAFGAFALAMRQKEFDRFSLVKPLFEIEELDNKNNNSKLKLKLLNYGGLVYFIGCEDNEINKEKLKITPRQYSSLSKEKSGEFLFENKINESNYFICYYRDVDTNLYELKIVYRKNPNTSTNGFYIDAAPFVYRSDLFVTMSQEYLDKIVNVIFPKDWYSKHEELKRRFEDECSLNELNEIDDCLLVKYNNSYIGVRR